MPTRLEPLAQAITGSRTTPRLATGAASRAALQAAGKPAATVGRTIHMPTAPDPSSPKSLGVVAHELTHVASGTTSPARSPVRPQFFGDDLFGAAESMAGRVGSTVSDAARSGGGAARSAAASAAGTATEAASSVASQARSAASSLPVGGPGAVAGAASEAINLVREEAAGILSSLQSAGAAAGGMADEAAGAAMGAIGDAQEAVSGAVAGAAGTATSAAQDLGAQASDLASQGAAALGNIGNAAVSAANDAQSQLGNLIEALEERVLAELERRGGRYAEMF